MNFEDMLYLKKKGLQHKFIQSSFFQTAPSWKCPLCHKNKYQLIRKRKDGKLYSEIESHHFGQLTSRNDTYMKAPSAQICSSCHANETKIFQTYKLPYHLSIPEMRGLSMHGAKKYTNAIKKRWKERKFNIADFM